ncbi:MAG TPA: hypothetical protein PK079_23170 [Leptospiraceae bacterium]|nr:hypothetical protein [Leptospiraceae bacterium]HMW06343.1 hypothetical protein [Leptospiraceae bacterium]HMX30978.1 hypothetical protein [Leptospiraceae bacterium]HMY32203.1 hypothetical protein [Leptospiraceae bacterium]HMZ63796.1 hypothetical protein [Leptospiraceae bacterium]
MKNLFKLSFFIGAIFVFNGCALFQQFLGGGNEPTFTLKSVDINKITLENISLKLLTNVRNPYPVSIPKSILDMNVLIEGTNLAKFSKVDLGKIEASSNKDLPVDVILKYSDLMDIYKKLPGKDLLNVKLDGVLNVPIPESYQLAGKKSFEFPFTQDKQIPAVLPTIDIRNFKIVKPDTDQISSGVKDGATNTAKTYLDNLLSGKKTNLGSAAQAGLSNVDIDVATEFEIALANQAAAALKFSDLKYDLALNGEKFLSGVPVDIINNGKESIVKVKTSFPLKSLSSGIADAIQKKSSDFKLKGLSGLNVPGLPDGTMSFDYDKSGSFKW